MEFKDPNEKIENIPVKYRAAFARWRNIKLKPLADRVWPYIKRGSKEECWPFIGKTLIKGYGVITLHGHPNRVRLLSHRLAWIVTHGEIPDGLHVLHKCDNPPCCNPDHLFLGTQQDNVRDMMQKGRQRTARGEDSPKAVLSASDVIRIRTLYQPGVITRTMLARMFGVSKSCIQHIVERRKWKHLP